MAAGTPCEKVGYTVTTENRPDDYMFSHCDCCEDCCCWVTITGMCCEEKCCPHPTGAVLYGGDTFIDTQGGATDNHSAGFFINDDWKQDPTGYGISGRAGDLQRPGGGQMPLGLVSIVDNSGIEYMSEVDYAGNVNSVWDDQKVFPVVIDAGMAYSEPLCGGDDRLSQQAYPPVTGPPGWVDVMFDKIDMGVNRNTPTPYTGPTNADTLVNVGYTALTTLHYGYTTLTDKPVYDTTNMVETNDVPITVLPTAQTTLDAGGWQVTNYEWTNFPAHTTLTSWNATALTMATHQRDTTKTTNTETPVYETHVVVVTPDYSPNNNSAHPTQPPPGFAGWQAYKEWGRDPDWPASRSQNDDFYYEPFVSLKMWREEIGSNALGFCFGDCLGHLNNYLLCTNGVEYKRLGTGNAVSQNDFTIGYPFSPIGRDEANPGLPIHPDYVSDWPTIYIPTERDCWQIADIETAECNIGGMYGEGIYDFAKPDVNGMVNYDSDKIGPDITGNEKEWWTKDRRIIFGFNSGTPYAVDADEHVWRHSSPYQFWDHGATDYGERFWPIDFHGCFQPEMFSAVPEGATDPCTWPVMGGKTGTELEWYLRFARRTGLPYHADDPAGWQLFSQRSFLEATNNYIKAKLGGDWRIARANEVIPDFEAPEYDCRQVMTHERVDDDGNIVATPYSAPIGTHEGRDEDDNSQWKYLAIKATGITNFHSSTWGERSASNDGGSVFGNHIKEQKAAGLGGFNDSPQYYGEQHCLMNTKDIRGGFEGCGQYSGESSVGYWEYEAGDITLQQLQENMGGAGSRVVGKGYFPAKTPVQTLTLVSEALTNTAVTTFNLSEPAQASANRTTWDEGGWTAGTYKPASNTHVTQAPSAANPRAGLPPNMTTTEESDGEGNLHLTPTPLSNHATQVPNYEDTYTITYSYGQNHTPIALNSTPTPVFTGFTDRETREEGDGTLTTLTTRETTIRELEFTDELINITQTKTGLGIYVPGFWGRRYSDWCMITRGCGHEDWVDDPLNLFETPFHAGEPCISCNEGAYTTGKNSAFFNPPPYANEEKRYEKIRNTFANFAWWDFNIFDEQWSVNGGFSNGALWDGKAAHWDNIDADGTYMASCDSLMSVHSFLDEHVIFDKAGARKIADLYNKVFEDYVYDSVPMESFTLDYFGKPVENLRRRWTHQPINQRMIHDNANKGEVWADEFNGVGVDFGWIENPSEFFNVSKDLYDESRCCKDGKRETTGHWPPGRADIAGGKTGMSCENHWNSQKEACFLSVEKSIELGCRTGDFWGVVDGGVYWNDVLQIGFDDFSGDMDTNYSLGFGMKYKDVILSGNTDDGDSRFLKKFTKTECCDEDGVNLPEEYATISATVKLAVNNCSPHGKIMITCPGQTEDEGCYSHGVHRVYTGDSDGGVWETEGKTYIVGMKGTDCACEVTGNADCDDDSEEEEEEEEEEGLMGAAFVIYRPLWSEAGAGSWPEWPVGDYYYGWPSWGTALSAGDDSHPSQGYKCGKSLGGFHGCWENLEQKTLYVRTGEQVGDAPTMGLAWIDGTNSAKVPIIHSSNKLYWSDPNPNFNNGETAAAEQKELNVSNPEGTRWVGGLTSPHFLVSGQNDKFYYLTLGSAGIEGHPSATGTAP